MNCPEYAKPNFSNGHQTKLLHSPPIPQPHPAGRGCGHTLLPVRGPRAGGQYRINIACIGVGGKGDSDSSDASNCGGNIVAICDVDNKTRDKKAKQFAEKFPHLKQFRDYRKMLEEMGKDIDAVTVSTPDHQPRRGVPPGDEDGQALLRQKPLVQTVYEARMMRQVAKEKNLATQMGNQGSAENGLRRAVEVVQAGVIGNPLEVHVWTNRPIWPQGLNRPEGSDPVPPTLDWDVWLGPAAQAAFQEGRLSDIQVARLV